MSLSAEAEAIFLDFGRRFNLVPLRDVLEDGDVAVVYSRQAGLQEEVWMCFENFDEISFYVGDFFGGSAFPCPNAFDEFIQNMDGILSGRYRIRYSRFGAVLEEPIGKSWKIRTRYSGPKWQGFRSRVFKNAPN